MNRKKIILGIVFFMLIVGVGVYKYTYQDHKNIETSDVDYNFSAADLSGSFIKNSQKASDEYLNKVIVVTGTISEKDNESITLDAAVLCYFDNEMIQNTDKNLKIKGRCIGFDELLEVVKLDQCSFVK